MGQLGGRPQLVVALVATVLLSGCAGLVPDASSVPAGAVSPGCPDMPWSGFSGVTDLPAPDGLTIARTPDGVRVSNGTATTWTLRPAWWVDQLCFGWSEAGDPGSPLSLAPGASADVPVRDPHIDGARSSRIGVEFWSGACAGDCPAQADGFRWIEVPTPGASG